MKIQDHDPQQVGPKALGRAGYTGGTGAARPARQDPASTVTGPREPAVRVELSGRARELQAALAAATAAPDVRAEKVAAVKTQVDNGTYAVDAKTVARRMLDVRA